MSDADPLRDEHVPEKKPPMFRDHSRGLRGAMVGIPAAIIAWVVLGFVAYAIWRGLSR